MEIYPIVHTGIGPDRQRISTFLTRKKPTLTNCSCAPDAGGVRTSDLWVSNLTLYPLSHPRLCQQTQGPVLRCNCPVPHSAQGATQRVRVVDCIRQAPSLSGLLHGLQSERPHFAPGDNKMNVSPTTFTSSALSVKEIRIPEELTASTRKHTHGPKFTWAKIKETLRFSESSEASQNPRQHNFFRVQSVLSFTCTITFQPIDGMTGWHSG